VLPLHTNIKHMLSAPQEDPMQEKVVGEHKRKRSDGANSYNNLKSINIWF